MGLELPRACFLVEDEVVEFATEVIEACDEAGRLEASLAHSTGRPRSLKVKAILVALLVLAMDGRPLHLTEVTRLLYSRLSARGKERLQVSGDASSHRCVLARYRCVRYLFHQMLEEMDPSLEHKNRVMATTVLVAKRKRLTLPEVERRRRALESFVNSLLEASCQVLGDEELSGYDGSAGLDATVVPLYSRGPSKGSGTCASDPDGGWYVRDGDHRDEEDHKGRKRSKVAWALEATIVTMARRPGAAPRHPNLAVGLVLARPGEDPGGVGVRVLASLSSRGYKPGFLGADRGYTQALPEHFHLPVRALGYSLVMDYKAQARAPGQLAAGRSRRRGLLLPGHARGARVGERRPPGGDDRRGDVQSRPVTARSACASCASQGPTTTATNASPARPSAATRTLSAPTANLRRPSASPGPVPHRCSRRRSAPSSRSRSLPTSGRATARSSLSGPRNGHAPTPPAATRSRAGTAI